MLKTHTAKKNLKTSNDGAFAAVEAAQNDR